MQRIIHYQLDLAERSVKLLQAEGPSGKSRSTLPSRSRDQPTTVRGRDTWPPACVLDTRVKSQNEAPSLSHYAICIRLFPSRVPLHAQQRFLCTIIFSVPALAIHDSFIFATSRGAYAWGVSLYAPQARSLSLSLSRSVIHTVCVYSAVFSICPASRVWREQTCALLLYIGVYGIRYDTEKRKRERETKNRRSSRDDTGGHKLCAEMTMRTVTRVFEAADGEEKNAERK